jgi:hypothetical protein
MEVEVAEEKEPGSTKTSGFWLGRAAATLLRGPIRCFFFVTGYG